MNNKWNLLEGDIIDNSSFGSINEFVINSVLLVVLAWLLAFTYRKIGKSLSNKKDFSANFILLSFTTMLVITIVKSSLALSLGLVGALSIVRFRAAIKEPEELAFLFVSISLGLGFGANQPVLVIVAFAILMAILWGRYLFGKKDYSQNIFITINSNKNNLQISTVNEIMGKYFNDAKLKRYDEQDGNIEILFSGYSKSLDSIEMFRNELFGKYPLISISFIENKLY